MLKWLKEKAEAAAANQCRFNIRLNAKSLVDMAQRQRNFDRDKRELGKDMVLGIANGLNAEDVINESEKAILSLDINTEARKGLEEIYQEVRELKN